MGHLDLPLLVYDDFKEDELVEECVTRIWILCCSNFNCTNLHHPNFFNASNMKS